MRSRPVRRSDATNWLALTSPVADQTRAQVVWDPDVVKAWRIVGYENRVTSAASFTQDRKEFAEVYSGAATTVFYELELHDDVSAQGCAGASGNCDGSKPDSGRGLEPKAPTSRAAERPCGRAVTHS